VVALQGGVALRVREDEREAGETKLVEDFFETGGEAVIGELDEEIVGGVEGIFAGVGDGVFDVVVAEVEIAAGSEGEGDGFFGEGCAEGGEFFRDELRRESVTAAGVGGADDVGDAVGNGHTGHGDGGFQVGRAIVEAGQKVMVDIDHWQKGYHHSIWRVRGSVGGVGCIERKTNLFSLSGDASV